MQMSAQTGPASHQDDAFRCMNQSCTSTANPSPAPVKDAASICLQINPQILFSVLQQWENCEGMDRQLNKVGIVACDSANHLLLIALYRVSANAIGRKDVQKVEATIEIRCFSPPLTSALDRLYSRATSTSDAVTLVSTPLGLRPLSPATIPKYCSFHRITPPRCDLHPVASGKLLPCRSYCHVTPRLKSWSDWASFWVWNASKPGRTCVKLAGRLSLLSA